jgi:hypothetical protein
MKLLSMWEPWASLYVHGAKRIETRHWPDSHHGWTAIFATKGGLSGREFAETCAAPFFCEALAGIQTFHKACIIGVVNIVACYPLNRRSWQPGIFEVFPDLDTPQERAFGNYDEGRYGFLAQETFALATPIPFVSRQGKFLEVPESIAEEIRKQWRGKPSTAPKQ